jgi:hypothetical protein
VAVVAAAVAGDFSHAVEQAHGGVRCRHDESSADQVGGDGVIVEVEADVDGLARAYGDEEVGFEGVSGQRQ